MFSLKEISLSKIHKITQNVISKDDLEGPGERIRLSWKLKLQELPTSLQQDLLVDAIKMAKIRNGYSDSSDSDNRWELAVNTTDPVEEYMNIFPIPIWGVIYSPDSSKESSSSDSSDEDD